MESFGNERRVQQGEAWNLDLKISGNGQPDVPYIVSNQLQNPCFVVTVASTKYEKNERYVKSWWNSLAELKLPTFYGTEPIYCGELDDVGGEDANKYTFNDTLTKTELAGLVDMTHGIGTDTNGNMIYGIRAFIDDSTEGGEPSPYLYNYVSVFIKENGSWHWQDIYKDDGTDSSDNGWITGMRAIYGTITFTDEAIQDSSLVAWLNVEATNDSEPQSLPEQPGEGTFSNYTENDSATTNYVYLYTKASDEIDKTLGRKPYYNFYFDYSTGEAVRVDDYVCELRQGFTTADTNEWTGQNYAYQITLVEGPLLADKIQEIYDYYLNKGEDLDDWPVSQVITFNDEIELTSPSINLFLPIQYDFKFTSDGQEFCQFLVDRANITDEIQIIFFSRIGNTIIQKVVYTEQDGWIDDNYKTIIFKENFNQFATEYYKSHSAYSSMQEIVNTFIATNASSTKVLTDEELLVLRYNYIKAKWPDALQPDIDSDSYLGEIITPIPILRPTKLEVMNNLRRLI